MENTNTHWRQSVDLADYGQDVQYRNKCGNFKLWRHNSLGNIASLKNKLTVYESRPCRNNNINKNKGNNVIVSIVLIEAKGLPVPPEDGSNHILYCKIRLGLETIRSKSVSNTRRPEWRERFQLLGENDDLLRIFLWDKGKLKNFMGRCVLDLSRLEKDRTHDIWQNLEDGYGLIHLSVTICTTVNPNIPYAEHPNSRDFHDENEVYNLTTSWKLVGKLHVKVIMGKGINAKLNPYCVLELDNESVRTPCSHGLNEPIWNKNYKFNVYDVTSTIDVKVYDSSLVSTIRKEPSGVLSIPLLRIGNGEARWYTLKDKYKRNSANVNCPRILLEMSLIWNPIKGSLRLFQPKEVKHIKETPKFDISLVYKNMEFIRDAFELLHNLNENFKRLFEWENQEISALALFTWILFWYYFKMWTAPLMLLAPFIYFWVLNNNQQDKSFTHQYSNADNVTKQNDNDKSQSEKRFTDKIQNLAEMTTSITYGTTYLSCLAERLYNLASFKVPFLSYLTMLLLIFTALVFYFVPYNYLMMSLGIYKFTRKYMHPERILNNDLLDFLSRIPDNELLKDWKELSVPEPVQRTQF